MRSISVYSSFDLKNNILHRIDFLQSVYPRDLNFPYPWQTQYPVNFVSFDLRHGYANPMLFLQDNGAYLVEGLIKYLSKLSNEYLKIIIFPEFSFTLNHAFRMILIDNPSIESKPQIPSTFNCEKFLSTESAVEHMLSVLRVMEVHFS